MENQVPCDVEGYMSITRTGMQPYTAVYYPFVVWVCGVIIFFVLRRIPRLAVIPYAAVMFLLGAAMGVGAELHMSDNQLNQSIDLWVRIDGSLLLMVFLPGLIFRDAIEINWDLFVCSVSQLLLLAYPMVLLGTGLVAVICTYVLPSYYNFSWALGATLGAILSSTDPIAVAAVLREVGAPPRLQIHITGESMFNDGAAIVFYSLFSQIYLSQLLDEEPIGWGEGIKKFVQANFGGLAMGIAFALGLVTALYELDRRLDPEYSILQVVIAISAAFTSYFAADICGMSGVVSCTVCGILSGRLGRGLINDTKMMDAYLKLMEHMLNSLMFALGGSIWGSILISSRTTAIGATDVAHFFAFFVLVLLIRVVQVALFYPILRQIGLQTNIREATFLAFGGLRGAVGIALSTSLFSKVMHSTCDSDSRYQDDATRLVFLSGGISLGTLLFNGTAAGWVLQKLGLAGGTGKTMHNMFDIHMQEFAEKEFRKLMFRKRFSDAIDFDIVRAHVPMLTKRPDQRMTDLSRVSSIADTGSQHHSSISRIASEREGNVDDKVVQLRLVFLDVLKEIYGHAAVKGELVFEGKDPALDVSAYRHSASFAEADANAGAMNDWKALQMFSTTQNDPVAFMRHKFARENEGSPQGRHQNYENYKKTRGQFLQAFCFILAHEKAQEQLGSYVESVLDETSRTEDFQDSNDLHSALQKVLAESHAEVADASLVIASIPVEDQRCILSHYVATIILNSTIKMLEEAATLGRLHYDEARSYIDKIEKECQPNHHIDGYICKCLSEHWQQLEKMVENVELEAHSESGEHLEGGETVVDAATVRLRTRKGK
jgi:NhaP-type Na+/H+ or K+/H+ antiporter